jgi:PAS domain S-box-containing protein
MATARKRPQSETQTIAAGAAAPAVERRPDASGIAPDGPSLADLAGVTAFVVDTSLRCLVADGDAFQLAGLTAADVMGRPIADLLDPRLSAGLTPHCRLALQGQPFAWEHTADGRTWLARGVPLGEGDAIHGALIVLYDVSRERDADAIRRRSGAAFASLIAAAPFALFVVDGALRVRTVNEAAAVLFGDVGPLLDRPLAEIAPAVWPPPLDAAILGELQHTLATGRAFSRSTRSGDARSERSAAYDWHIRRITLPDGTTGAACYASDVAPIREAERVLTQAAARDAFLVGFADAVRSLPGPREVTASAAARLGQALQANHVAYADVDVDGTHAAIDDDWNDGSMPSNAGRHRLDAFGPAVVDELRAGRTVVVDDVWTHPNTSSAEARAAFARVNIRACVSVPLVKAGRLVAVLTVVQRQPRAWQPTEVALAVEVAERTWAAVEQARAEARLRSSEARLTLVLEASGMGTFVWHLDEQRVVPDACALELLGLTDVGVPLDEALDALVPSEDRESCAAVLARALDPAGTGRLQTDVRVRRPDGTERWLAITARAIFAGEPRRAVHLAGVVATIDDRKRAEASLRARDEALTVADRRKDEFLAVLAHELRNPLAPIRAGLELIRLSGDSRETVERTREIMERQVGHMVRLIDDLLDVSRITSGKIQLKRRPTSLEGLIGIALDANRHAILAGALELDLAMPDTPVWLDADPTRLVQVISNVLHNAVKFTDAGGRVEISASVEAAAEGGQMLALVIADSGIGISAEMLPRIFELFTQDRAGSSRSRGGLGIGLALARRLVEMHGGRIDVSSEGPGRGTAFAIRLPVATIDAPRPAEAGRDPAARTRHRVLVVDDNVDAARAMAMLVSAQGGEARVAIDGPSALALVQEWAPTLVLLDIGMPGMDGYETCRRIRDAVGTSVTIAAVTGWGQEQDKREAERAGFDAHLIKPADPAALQCLLVDPPRTP